MRSISTEAAQRELSYITKRISEIESEPVATDRGVKEKKWAIRALSERRLRLEVELSKAGAYAC